MNQNFKLKRRESGNEEDSEYSVSSLYAVRYYDLAAQNDERDISDVEKLADLIGVLA